MSLYISTTKRRRFSATRLQWRYEALVLLLLLLATAAASAHNQQQQQPQPRARILRDNNNNNTPKEKDVSAIPRQLCSTQALLDADISKNKFISRAEYVNLLLDLAPDECPIIDSWLNDAPLQSTFDELSCLCHEYGGVDGENNCCLQAVGVPMLASFAVPGSYYADEYAAEACHIIDLVLHQECPMSFSPTDTPTVPPTRGPTLEPTTTEPSTSPSTIPTVTESEEETQAGETVNVIIEGGDVTVEEPPEKMEHYEGGVTDDDYHGLAHGEAVLVTVLEEQEEEEEPGPPLPQSQSNDEEVVQQEEEVQEEEEEEPVVVVTTTESEKPEVTLKPSQPATTLPPDTNIPLVQDGSWNDGGLVLQQAPQNPAVHNQRQAPVGIVLAALLAVSFAMTLGLFALWGKRRREYKKQQQMEPTVISDGGDHATTPIRSNASRSRTAWSSDGDDSSTEDDDDDSDIERPRLASRAGGPVVVRAEFQDDLSIWGRRKRRKQERKQRREERKSLSHQAQSYGSSMSNVLNTLEYEGNANDGLMLSKHNPASECSPHSSLAGKCSTIHNPSTPKADIDIFDDTSETSSCFDGSPEATQPLPLETSIENWLEQVQNLSPSPANQSVHSQMLDDQSTASRMSAASRMSRKSQHSTASSKSNQQATSHERQSKQGAVLRPTSSRSFSPARSCHSTRSVPYSPLPKGPTILVPTSPPASQCFNIMASSASFSPSSSPKRTSRSVPASPSSARSLLETSLLSSPRISPSTSTPSSPQRRKTILTNTTAHLDLPVENTHRPNRLSPDSQEFYDSVLRLEPSDEDDEDLNHGSPFAFETARRRDMVRYLV